MEAELVADLRAADWTLSSCDFDREETLQRDDGVEVVYRVWTDCGQNGQLLYDGVAIPSSGGYAAWIQVQLEEGTEPEIAAHILETFRVLPERL